MYDENTYHNEREVVSMGLGTISIILTVAGAGISLVSSLVDKKKREQDIAEAVEKYIKEKIDNKL